MDNREGEGGHVAPVGEAEGNVEPTAEEAGQDHQQHDAPRQCAVEAGVAAPQRDGPLGADIHQTSAVRRPCEERQHANDNVKRHDALKGRAEGELHNRQVATGGEDRHGHQQLRALAEPDAEVRVFHPNHFGGAAVEVREERRNANDRQHREPINDPFVEDGIVRFDNPLQH